MRWPSLARRDHLGLVRHQVAPSGGVERRGLRERHAGRGTAVLEGLQQRPDELPRRQAAPGDLGLGGGEVRDQEGVGELARDDRLRDHLALHDGRGVLVDDLLDGLGGLDAGGLQHLGLQLESRVGDVGVLGQEREQGRVAGGGLGQDRADAVEPLQLLAALALRDGLVGLDPGPLLARQLGDDLELRPRGGLHRAALDPLLDLAHCAGEHRDDPLVVELAAVALAPAVAVARTVARSVA